MALSAQLPPTENRLGYKMAFTYEESLQKVITGETGFMGIPVPSQDSVAQCFGVGSRVGFEIYVSNLNGQRATRFNIIELKEDLEGVVGQSNDLSLERAIKIRLILMATNGSFKESWLGKAEVTLPKPGTSNFPRLQKMVQGGNGTLQVALGFLSRTDPPRVRGDFFEFRNVLTIRLSNSQGEEMNLGNVSVNKISSNKIHTVVWRGFKQFIEDNQLQVNREFLLPPFPVPDDPLLRRRRKPNPALPAAAPAAPPLEPQAEAQTPSEAPSETPLVPPVFSAANLEPFYGLMGEEVEGRGGASAAGNFFGEQSEGAEAFKPGNGVDQEPWWQKEDAADPFDALLGLELGFELPW